MSSQSKIEWTEQTWNPTTGCTKVSPGCKHCYAETMARRLKAMGAGGYENGFEFAMHEYRLQQPLIRKKPTVYFVNSMSDLFHEDITDDFLDKVFHVIRQTPRHTPGQTASPTVSGWQTRRALRLLRSGEPPCSCPPRGSSNR